MTRLASRWGGLKLWQQLKFVNTGNSWRILQEQAALAGIHHVPELVIKAVWQRLFGKSSSPSNQTFVQFRDKFGLILIKMLIPPHSS